MIPPTPPPTEIPDYILYRRERQPYPPRRPKKLPPPRPIIVHSYRSLEDALTAAKSSARRNRLYYGRSGDEFRVYEGENVIERYVVGKG